MQILPLGEFMGEDEGFMGILGHFLFILIGMQKKKKPKTLVLMLTYKGPRKRMCFYV